MKLRYAERWKLPASSSSTKTAVALECASASGSGQNSRSKGNWSKPIGVINIRRAELADGETSMTAANDLAVRWALELAGVEFIDENGGRITPPQRPAAEARQLIDGMPSKSLPMRVPKA
jgi:hypothetical protein